jgi:hypothetical protein
MRMLLRTVLCVGAVLGASGALARADEARPPMLPTRDVAVVYRLQSPDGKEQHVMKLYSADAGAKMRMESPERPGYMIMDRADKKVIVVIAERKSYVEGALDPKTNGGFLLNDDMQFTKSGTDTVAGQACTVWDVQGGPGRNAKVCVTADGVVLRGQAVGDAQSGSIEATEVSYAAQPAALFAPPPDYQKLDMQRAVPPPQ